MELIRSEVEAAAKADYRDILYWAQTGPLSEFEGHKLQELARGVLETWGKNLAPPLEHGRVNK